MNSEEEASCKGVMAPVKTLEEFDEIDSVFLEFSIIWILENKHYLLFR